MRVENPVDAVLARFSGKAVMGTTGYGVKGIQKRDIGAFPVHGFPGKNMIML